MEDTDLLISMNADIRVNSALSMDTLTENEINPFNIYNEVAITGNDDLDPDLNLFNPITRSLSKYYSEDTFNKMINCSNLQDNIKILHLNICSYNRNHNNLWTYIKNIKSKFHIIALTETWSTFDNEDQIIYPGYITFAKSRTTDRGGGVALLVDESLQAQIISINGTFNSLLEYLFVNISLPNSSNIMIGSLYRPPNSDVTNFNLDMETLLNSLPIHKKPCYICGDFNLNLLNINSHHPTNEFVNNMSSAYFRPLITMPTRLTGHSSTLIDNIFSNTLKLNEYPGILYADISDHLPIFVILDCKIDLIKKSKFVMSRPNNEQATAHLYALLENETWNDIYNLSNPDDISILLNDKLNRAYNASFPLEQRKHRIYKTKTKPWLTKSLLKSCKKKNKLYKYYLKHKSVESFNKYRTYKNRLTIILRKCEKQYYVSRLDYYRLKITYREFGGSLRKRCTRMG
jgi:exonuclease III